MLNTQRRDECEEEVNPDRDPVQECILDDKDDVDKECKLTDDKDDVDEECKVTDENAEAMKEAPKSGRFQSVLEQLNMKVGGDGLVFHHNRKRKASGPNEVGVKKRKHNKPRDYGIEGDLFKAVIRDDVPALTVLLQHADTPSPRNPADLDGLGKGATPLHVAAQRGFIDSAKKLITSGAMVNLPTLRGVTPLHSAAQGGRVDVMKLLIAHGAQLACKTRSGATAVDFAGQYPDMRSRKQMLHVLREPDVRPKRPADAKVAITGSRKKRKKE